jgi:hypothetical protein
MIIRGKQGNIPVHTGPCRKIIVIILLVLPFFGYAQRKKVQNNPSYDNQVLHFGFILGYNSADFVSVPAENFHAMDSVYDIVPGASGGFNLQIVSNLRIFENMDLRFLPGLSFVQRDLNYTLILGGNPTTQKVKKTVESTFVEFPLMLKFKSNRINNYRMYVFGGIKYSLDLASRKEDRDSKDKQPVKIEQNDYGYEIGFGLDLYLSYIKISPEIKMFTGVRNLLVKDEFVFSNTLDKLYSKIFTFSLTFE